MGPRTIAWRYVTHRKLRYALTAFGIVLGVANVFGVLVTTASTNRAVYDRSAQSADGADVFAGTNDDGNPFSAEEIALFKRLPQTQAVTAMWGGFDSKASHRVPVFLGAVDRTGARQFLRTRLLGGRLMRPGRPEAVVSRSAARLLGLGIGKEWSTLARGGRRAGHGPLMRLRPGAPGRLSLRITGIVDDPPGTDNSVSSGSFTSLEYVWHVLTPPVATEVRFYLDRNVDATRWAAEHEQEFPTRSFRALAPPAEFRRFITILQSSMSGAAAIAVFVGAFLIYLTFSMNVIERTRLLGTLHAIGASPGQVARAVLVEALTLGMLATIAGLVLGLGISRLFLPLTARVLSFPSPKLVVTPRAVIAGVAVGLVTTLVGSLIPARRAGRLTPVEAIRGDQTFGARASRWWIAGLVLVVASTGSGIASRGIDAPSIFAQGATLALLLGSVLVLPPLLGPLARTARGFFRRWSGGLGDIALMHLVRERSHSAYTLGLVMVVLAMMLSLASANRAVGRVVESWVDKRLGADLIAYRQGIEPGTETKVAAVAGVAGVTWASFQQTQVVRPASTPANLVIIDPRSFFDVAGFPWSDGDDLSARRALERGGGVLLPGTMASRLGVHRGQELTVQTPRGPKDFRVVATYASIGEGQEIGVIAGVKDAEILRGGKALRNVLYINFTPGVSFNHTRLAVDSALIDRPSNWNRRASFGPRGGVGRSGYFFVTGPEIKTEARRQLRSYFAPFYAVLFVAVLVGLLGLANTMASSVVRRTREIGIVHAVGADPRHVSRMVRAEAALLVGVAFVFSLALGTLVSWLIVAGIGSILGFSISLVFPWNWVPTLGVLAAVIALVCASVPARRASSLSPVEALRYE